MDMQININTATLYKSNTMKVKLCTKKIKTDLTH